MTFKVGDEVIKVRGKDHQDLSIGDEGIIVNSWRGDLGFYVRVTKGRYKDSICCSETCNFELKYFYGSPLYKALE